LTIKLDGLAAVMLFALIGAVLWMLRQDQAPSLVIINGDDVETVDEEIDMPWLGG
jgi:hypothetical protein